MISDFNSDSCPACGTALHEHPCRHIEHCLFWKVDGRKIENYPYWVAQWEASHWQLEYKLGEALKRDSRTLACMIVEAEGDIRPFYESFKEAGWKSYWKDKQNMKPTIEITPAGNGYIARFQATPEDPLGQRPEIEHGPYVFETFDHLVTFLRGHFDERIPLTATEIRKAMGLTGC